MAFFGRRRRLPEAHRPPLERDERVLAWAVTAASPSSTAGPAGAGSAGAGSAGSPPVEQAGRDAVLVATNRGLWLPLDPPARLGWHEIHKAVWTGEQLEITAARVAGQGAGYELVEDLPTVRFALADPGDLPNEVRARVTRSVGPSTHHSLPGGGGARVAARRVPGVDGLHWTVRYDPGVDRDDPVVREVTDELVAQARAGAGGEP